MKKLILLFALICGSHSALAEDDILSILENSPKDAEQTSYRTPLRKMVSSINAEQQIFFQFIDQGDYEKALYQWPEAFSNTDFEKTSNGQALHALLQYKNGLHVIALEKLLTFSKPHEVSADLLKEWKQLAPEGDPAWGMATLTWKPEWTPVFGEATEIRVRGRDIFGSDKTEEIKSLLVKTRPGSPERSLIEWQLVLASSEKDTGEAAKVLAHLMKQENNPISPDLMNITAARFLFQKGFMDAAIKYYEKVGKKSDYWFEAQEEMAWSYMRKGEPNKALAITKTITLPYFLTAAGPEAEFLKSLAQLKVCDYPAVVKTLGEFRDTFKPRVDRLKEMADTSVHQSAVKAVAELKKKYINLHELKGDAANLPRMVTRDRLLKQLIATEKKLEEEAQQAGVLYSRSLAGGAAKVGFQGYFEELKKGVEMRVHTAKSTTLNRIREMARFELEEISTILQKLHIVEAEVLQQTSLADRVIKDSSKKMAVNMSANPLMTSNKISFPDSSELWFDELTNHQVDIQNGCQAVKR